MKNKSILIIVVVIIIFLSVLALFWVGGRNNKESAGGGNDLFSFNFFGGEDNRDSEIASGDRDENVVGLSEQTPPKLRKITPKEVSGFGLFDEGGTTTVRFIDTESGNIFEANSKSLKTTRVTNTTILQTVDSLWVDKDNLILRYVDEGGEIQSFAAEMVLKEGGEFAELEGVFMEVGIESIDTHNGKIFALLKNSGGSNGLIYSPDLESQDNILNTPLREIRGLWAGNNTIAINTKPSAGSLGHLFFLNTGSGSLTNILSSIRGLDSNVSKNTQSVLYSQSENFGISLWYFKDDGGLEKVTKDTFAEKCVWADSINTVVYCAVPKNISFRNLPDEWYKGNISFSDELWKVDLRTGEMEMVLNLEGVAGEAMDVIEISINEKEDYLAFINKKDMVLWAVDLSQNKNN